MRAVFYHPGGRWCGEARAFVAAARGLGARGWQARFATASDSPAHAHATAAGVAVAPLGTAESFVGAVGDLARVLRAAKAEVVFAHGERGYSVAAGAMWRAGGGAVVCRVPAGGALAFGSAAARAALRTAPTGFLCTWPEQAERVPPRARSSAVVADLGVPPAAGAPAPNSANGGPAHGGPAHGGPAHGDNGQDAVPGGRRIVCVYEPTAQLRAATVLRAAAMLAPRHPGLQVVLTGPGAADEGLRMHAAALGIHQLVRVHDPAREAARGNGHTDAAPPLAGAAVAWVVAEGDDGAFGALDAMAAGVPVLAERGATAARYVADAITGLHLAPGDVPGTAAVLAQLFAGDETRRAMGNAGRSRVARTYTEAAMLDGFARAAAAARERMRTRT